PARSCTPSGPTAPTSSSAASRSGAKRLSTDNHPEVFHMQRSLILTAVVLALAAWPLAHLASAGPPSPAVPGDIAVPAGNKVFLVGHAVGVQIYSCNATASGYSWSLVAPRADLYSD